MPHNCTCHTTSTTHGEGAQRHTSDTEHTPWLVDGNKWCDNKVETPDVHCALKALHGCQQRTQIVMSVGKVACMTTAQMPCDNTHNHAWRVEHNISLNGTTCHTVLYTTRHGCDGCSATTSSPKPFPFLNASHSAHIWLDMPTPTN